MMPDAKDAQDPVAELATTTGQKPVLSGWRYRAVIYSVVLSALGYLLFSLFGGWRDVAATIGQVGIAGVLIALSLSLVNYGLRFARWQLYLYRLGHAVPWWPSLRIYLAGFALTTTPGKAGEAFRSVLLKRWSVPYSDSIAAFFSERLSDLLAIVILTLLGLTIYPAARPLIYIGLTLSILFLILLSSRTLLLSLQGRVVRIAGKARKAAGHVFTVLLQAQRCHHPRLLVLTTVLSVAGWLAEAFAFYLILHWVGAEVSFTFAAFVFALSMLAGALSFTPGGLGSTEGVMAALLIFQGVGSPEAIGATLLIRVTTLWFAVGLGLLTVSTNVFEKRPTQDLS